MVVNGKQKLPLGDSLQAGVQAERAVVVGLLQVGEHGLGLDGRLIHATTNAESSLLTPAVAPRVLDTPVLLAIVLTPASHQHGMVDLSPLLEEGGPVLVDPGLVVHEIVRRLDRNCDGPVAVDLLHHVGLLGPPVEAADVSVLRDLVLVDRGWVAGQLAHALRCVVGAARLGHQSDVLGPLGDQLRVAPVTALVVLAAEQRELGRESLSAGVVLHDAPSRGHHGHRGNSIATPAAALVGRGRKEILAVLVAPVEILGHVRDPLFSLA
mmetsp:Transcript_26858/g.59376  ORF Transcript_26858/g.59376 Transcript_26858/m.59376 type:complete len:267 (-) Transcript_26858:828-1628(-)